MRPEQEHAGQRCHAQFTDFVTQIDLRLHVHHGIATGHDHEAIGAGCARGIKQRINRQTFIGGFRTLNPELTEARKLFSGRQRGINSQSAGRKPIYLALTEHAEIAGSEHADDLIVLVFAVDRIQNLKARKTEVFNRVFIVLNVAKIKIVRAIFNFTYAGCRHFINGDRRIEIHSLVIKLELERAFQIIPIGFVVIKLNLLIVRILHVAEGRGQVTFRRFKAFAG